jgi:hypothetical protein
MAMGIMIALTLYSAFVLPIIMGITEDLETYNPRIIHLGAFTGFLSFLTYIFYLPCF